MTTMWNAPDPASLADAVDDMAEAARWAPSVHNIQPWQLVRRPDGLGVRLDPDRTLPVMDPHDRLRTISCGAAVLNASVALAARDIRPRIDLLPDPDDRALLAVVRVGGSRPASDDDRLDASALMTRRAHRRVHRRDLVPDDVLDVVQRAVAREGARLTVADAGARRALARLLARAVREQAGNPALVQEIEGWIRHWGAAGEPADGIPVGSLGTAPYPVDSLVQEQTSPDVVHEAELEETLRAATVVAITTPGDARRDWVVAGMALERLWLRATALGYVLTFADQATQQPDTRSELPDVLDVLGHPQLVVRLGMPLVDVPPTPRRPLAELLR